CSARVLGSLLPSMTDSHNSGAVLTAPAPATGAPRITPSQAKPQSGSHQRFIRDLFFSNLPLPVMKLRSYLWLALLSRWLGPTGYGAWALFHTTLDISISRASMTLGGAMMRFLSGERTTQETRLALSSVFWATSTAGGFIAFLLAAFSTTLATVVFHGAH